MTVLIVANPALAAQAPATHMASGNASAVDQRAPGVANPRTAEPLADCLMEPRHTVEVRSPVAGILKEVPMTRGQSFKKGRLLARLDDTPEEAAENVARHRAGMTGALAVAETRRDAAKKRYERLKSMHDSKLAAAQELDDAHTELRQAEAELVLARENRETARLELAQQSRLRQQKTVLSPIDGVVVDQLAFVGEVVEPNDPRKPILRIAQVDPLRVRAIFPLRYFGRISAGQRIQIEPEAPVGGQYGGTVAVVDPVVNAASATFTVFVDVANPGGRIPAGIRCTARLGDGHPAE